MPTDIRYVIINNTVIFDIPKKFTYTIPCGYPEESVIADFTLGGDARSYPVNPMKLPANIPQTVTVTTSDGKTENYSLLAVKSLSSDIFVQRWDDILAINNNPFTNGGYEFTGYVWYKNNDKVPLPNETKGYIRMSAGTAEYWVELTGKYIPTQTDVNPKTCPIIVTNVQTKAAVYPNPVQRGQMVRVETGKMGKMEETSRDAARHVSTMQLFDTAGNIIAKQILHDPVSEIVMPDMPGQYILQVMVNGVSESFKIVVE